MRAAIGILTAAAASAALSAQIVPTPDRADRRIASARFDGTAPVWLQVPVTRPVTVLLPAGEEPGAVTLGAPADWLVNVDNGGASFSVRAVRPVPDSELTVTTPARTFRFLLTVSADPATTRIVRLTAPGAKRVRTEPVRSADTSGTATYRLSGKRELWPSSIRDDGQKMYLEWSADQALPAVFAVDRLGREEMVNGYMRGTVFTIDRVHEQLEFRIDKASAAARRKAGRNS